MSNWDTKFARRGFTFDDVLLILQKVMFCLTMSICLYNLRTI